jgi:TolB protein
MKGSWNVRFSTLLTALLSVLAVTIVVVCTQCALADESGRWSHYSVGGSFIGCNPSVSPTSRVLIYSTPRTGHGDIYAAALDGDSRKRLTDDENYEGDAAWSHDGQHIVFVRESKGLGRIWTMKADGKDQRQLTFGPGYDFGPAFAPDDGEVMFSRGPVRGSATPAELYTVKVDGAGERQLTHNNELNWAASFSPDGNQILFAQSGGRGTIWIMDRGTRRAKNIGQGSWPSFSPDGRQIAFLRSDPGTFQYDVFSMDTDGQNVRRLTNSGGYKSSPCYCFGGKSVTFLSEPKADGLGVVIAVEISDLRLKTLLDLKRE